MNQNKTLKVLSLFSGVGFQETGIINCGLYDVESVGTSEIDINACISYAAIHCGMTPEMIENYDYPSRQEMADCLHKLNIGYDFKKGKEYNWQKKVNGKDTLLNKTWLACKLQNNLGDVSRIESIPSCDILTYSFPCTDISIAGQLKGLEGTRSGLLYEVDRLLKITDNKPKMLLMENVDNLVGKTFKPYFDEWCERLEEFGYKTYWKVMNTKYTGIPQNRRRVYALSVNKDINMDNFDFPIEFDNGVRLKDILDTNVDEKYYINNERAEQLIEDLIINGKLVGYV